MCWYFQVFKHSYGLQKPVNNNGKWSSGICPTVSTGSEPVTRCPPVALVSRHSVFTNFLSSLIPKPSCITQKAGRSRFFLAAKSYRGIRIKTPPLKVRIWEFSFRGLNCAKNSRNSASGVLIVPKIQSLMNWKTYQSLSGYQKNFACGGLLSDKNYIIYLEFGTRSNLFR